MCKIDVDSYMRKSSLFFLSLLFVLFISCSDDADPDTYSLSLTATPEEGGSVTPANAEFEADRSVEISASPNEHWVFNGWQGDYEGTDNPVVITMDSDKDIAALFVKRDYPLTININNEEGGDVTERIVQQKTTEYPHGTVVELTAEPNNGWEFVGWQGDMESDENPVEVTIEGETEITANFERIEYPLTINIEGDGNVEETVVEAKAKDYPFGTVVELTAIPDENWIFDRWSGDLESDESTAEIVIDEAKEVTATFLRTFTFTTVIEPQGGGEITPEAGDYVRDTNLEVEAIPASDGWRFTRWEGDFSGGPAVNPFSLTMNGNKTIVANFERREFFIESEIQGQGMISSELLSGTETEKGYLYESEVELTAIPEEDWHFERWEGDINTEQNPIVVTVDSTISLTAVFSIFEGGTGSESDPFQVATLRQLIEVGNQPDAHYSLINDIDASETENMNNGSGFQPIGDEEQPFTGSFRGNGFEISDLTINRPDQWYVGLFGVSGQTSAIENLFLQNVSITGERYVGGLAGRNEGIITSVEVMGNVEGQVHTGGLTGANLSDISESNTSGSVIGMEFTGGLAGSHEGVISDSYSTGSVEGSGESTGGLAGDNRGVIQRSFAAGSVTGSENVGGLVGLNRGLAEIKESYATGNVEGNSIVGGLVGLSNDGEPVIADSYAFGNVEASSSAGGFIGEIGESVQVNRVYSTGQVTGLLRIGGFSGINNGDVSAAYWDTDSSNRGNATGTGDSSGMNGLETGQMTGDEAVTNMPEFDWADIWIVTDNYPALRWQ